MPAPAEFFRAPPRLWTRAEVLARPCPVPGRKVRTFVLDRDGHRCQVCDELATEVDHLIPWSRGGSDDPANVRAICRTCNRRKGARMPV